MAAYHIVWECVVEQWLGMRRLLSNKRLLHVSILSDHHQGALFLAKVIIQYSQFNSYLQTRCSGSISCCVVEQWLGVRRTSHT